jgi:hypothetical protein
VDPLTDDPAQIEVALILPPGLQVAQNGATLTIEAARGDQVEKAQATLQEARAPLSGFAVPKGARVMALRIRPTDLDRLRATQTRMAAWRVKRGEKTSVRFGVGLDACTMAGGPAKDSVASMLIRPETGAPIQPFIKRVHLRDALGAEVFDAIQPCEGAQ